MKDFLAFRSMLTPVLIRIVFILGIIVCIGVALNDFFSDTGAGVLQGLQVLIVGPIALRIICEIFILFFRINETLTEIKHQLATDLSTANKEQ